jgi:ATP phosphoribosyltransferase regulatory subunit
MMKKWHIYTPDGVSDILFDTCAKKRAMEADIRRVFQLSGYRELETPSLEFYDVYGGDNALIRQEQMYKFTDAQGRLLVLKPDMTIPVARVAATQFRNPVWPMKCFYIGNTFSADELGGGRQNEFTQAGIELLGVNTPEADAEIIATAVQAVRATGLEEFQIDVGQVEFFRGIMEESGLLPEEIEEIRVLTDRKDFVGVAELVARHRMPEGLKALILDMPKLFGSRDIIQRLEGQPIGARATAALESLRTVLEILEDRGMGAHVSIDLGMVQSLGYYTGIVFRGYTHGVGFPILSGGRYDSLVSRFGMDCPATGFSMGVNFILMALERQQRSRQMEPGGVLVTYAAGGRTAAAQACDRYRAAGLVAELDVAGRDVGAAEAYARARGHRLLALADETGMVTERQLTASAAKGDKS